MSHMFSTNKAMSAVDMSTYGIGTVVLTEHEGLDRMMREYATMPDQIWCDGRGKKYLHKMLRKQLLKEDKYFDKNPKAIQRNSERWAIFMDGDMLVRDDIEKLWALRDDSKAVMVVKHDYKTKMTEKYLGAKNENYPRKNWSSVILWNCGHAANKVVTPEFIETATGAQLHRFTWLADELVGELPKVWNWLPDEFGANQDAKLLHYTLGTPSFHDFATTPMGDEWHRERIYTDYCLQRNL